MKSKKKQTKPNKKYNNAKPDPIAETSTQPQGSFVIRFSEDGNHYLGHKSLERMRKKAIRYGKTLYKRTAGPESDIEVDLNTGIEVDLNTNNPIEVDLNTGNPRANQETH